MSNADEEARALDAVTQFLYDLGNGTIPARPIGPIREQARRLTRHYPLGAGRTWLRLKTFEDTFNHVIADTSNHKPQRIYTTERGKW